MKNKAPIVSLKELRSRIKKLQNALKKESYAAMAVIEAGAEKIRSRDTNYSFRQNSDFWYLTGSEQLRDAALLVSSEKVVLVVKKVSKKKKLWEGAGVNAKVIARNIGAQFLEIESTLSSAIACNLLKVDLVLLDTKFASSKKVSNFILNCPGNSSIRFVGLLEQTMASLRLYKSATEISFIEEANKITAECLTDLLPYIKPGATEKSLLRRLEANFFLHDVDASFRPIIATLSLIHI